MFKINPIRQAIFEGFFQHIVAIDRTPTDQLDPEFLRVPMFCIRNLDDNHRTDGWKVILRLDSSVSEWYFTADRAKQTLVTGTLDLSPSDQNPEIDVPFILPKPSGAGDTYTSKAHDVSACIWIEYLPAMITDDNGQQIEAHESYVPNIHVIRDTRFDQPTFNNSTGNAQIYFSTTRTSRVDKTLPTIRGVRIHYAIQAAYFYDAVPDPKQDPGRILRADVALFEQITEPPEGVVTRGLPKLEHKGIYGFVATSRTTKNLVRRATYKLHAAYAHHTQQIGDNPPRTFNVANIASVYRATSPDDFNISFVQRTQNNGSFRQTMLEFSGVSRDSELDFSLEFKQMAHTLQSVSGENFTYYGEDNTGYIVGYNYVYMARLVSFSGLTGSELNSTYRYGSTVQTYNQSATRISGVAHKINNSHPVADATLSNSATVKRMAFTLDAMSMLTINFENKDTPQSLAVSVKDERVSKISTSGSDYSEWINERVIGRLKFESLVFSTNKDPASGQFEYRSNPIMVGQGYRYIDEGGLGAPTKPVLPIVTGWDNVALNVNWTVFY